MTPKQVSGEDNPAALRLASCTSTTVRVGPPCIRDIPGVSRVPRFAGFAGLLTSAAGSTHREDEVEPVRPELRGGLDGNAN
jgi:hypothetical protein